MNEVILRLPRRTRFRRQSRAITCQNTARVTILSLKCIADNKLQSSLSPPTALSEAD